MFSDPTSINDLAAAAKSFTRISILGPKAEYTEGARSPSEPRNMVISHDVDLKKQIARRLVKFTDTDVDANGVSNTCSIALTIVHSTSVDASARLSDLGAFIRNFVTDTNLGRLQDGEI
jgi:hypothetical protein